jgi:hypothetical protein
LLPRSTIERLLTLLLVGALLLCHGAFGSLHQVKGPVLSEHLTVEEHTSHHEEHGPADGHPVGEHDYAAALFALLLGMVYALLRGETRSRDAFPAPRRTGSLPTTRVFHLPRGPGPPLSQVFRL